MHNNLKTILLKIAALSEKDQRWILDQLPESCKQPFHHQQGAILLAEARPFGKLKLRAPANLPVTSSNLYTMLPDKPALFMALVLQEGGFKQEQALLNLPTDHIKADARKILFDLWKQQTQASLLPGDAHHATTTV